MPRQDDGLRRPHTYGGGRMTLMTMARRAATAGVIGTFLAVMATVSMPMADVSAADCGTTNNCTADTFADAMLSSISAPDTQVNRRAFETWEDAEGGNWQNNASCNPLNTTQREPGSHSINSVGVQAYANASGKSCWTWGITATYQTLKINGGDTYRPILHTLRNPVSSDHGQCVALAEAVASTPWGTGTFSADCA